MKNLTKKQISKIAEINTFEYVKLIRWLYRNHINILRQYEKKMGKVQVEFLDRR